MEATNVVLTANLFTANFSVTCGSPTTVSTSTSSEYLINSSAVIQMQVITAPEYIQQRWKKKNFVFLRFKKRLVDDNCTYTIMFTSNELGITDKSFTDDDGTWRVIHENNEQQQFSFKVTVEMEVVPCAISFDCLHEDTELTNFELRGEDGSVHMHRAVLAAASPVLRRMLGGTWRETTEGRVDVPGTSTATLQNFKNYVYLRKLPESGLEELLLLSSYYMMPDLEQRCVDKLVRNLSSVNACDMIEFAVKHKVTRLLLVTLQQVQSGTVNVLDMLDHFTRTNTK